MPRTDHAPKRKSGFVLPPHISQQLSQPGDVQTNKTLPGNLKENGPTSGHTKAHISASPASPADWEEAQPEQPVVLAQQE
ncbi:hypothetical protein NDU88_010503 [Pleurodeles waltl]|uniref:Uncharacterized protein n=1 Tax=Pleurodeles waltl TaxID=8319 RepID=A0AAV7PY43_PLEWA|nr:hypothetical protein NDU88_010503 [Pleurodeles waltl]